MRPLSRSRPRVVFAALDTYSLVGGLQQFNRRVMKTLAAITIRPHGHFMRDTANDIPASVGAQLFAHGANHFAFIRGTVRSSSDADILLLGHVNLLPVGALARVFNRKLKVLLFVHGDDVWNDPIYRKRRWYDTFLSRHVHRIAAVSDFTANVMSKEFSIPKQKFVIFPNAVDPLPIAPLGPAEKENILVVTAACRSRRS